MAIPRDWGIKQTRLFDDIAETVPQVESDRMAQVLYDNALFNFDITSRDRRAVTEAMKNYFRDTYGVEFDAVFSWDGYREAYDSGRK